MGKWWISALTYTLLSSSALLIIMSGVGIRYFNNEMLIVKPDTNLMILFGSGVASGLIVFIGIWFFLLIPKFLCHYVFTFPLFAVILSLIIAYMTPSEAVSYINNWSNEWVDGVQTQSLQMKHQCCGWNNYSDRGLDPCPYSFESGCKKVLVSYIVPRYNEILVSSIFTLALGLVSLGGLVISCAIGGADDLLANLDHI